MHHLLELETLACAGCFGLIDKSLGILTLGQFDQILLQALQSPGRLLVSVGLSLRLPLDRAEHLTLDLLEWIVLVLRRKVLDQPLQFSVDQVLHLVLDSSRAVGIELRRDLFGDLVSVRREVLLELAVVSHDCLIEDLLHLLTDLIRSAAEALADLAGNPVEFRPHVCRLDLGVRSLQRSQSDLDRPPNQVLRTAAEFHPLPDDVRRPGIGDHERLHVDFVSFDLDLPGSGPVGRVRAGIGLDLAESTFEQTVCADCIFHGFIVEVAPEA